METEQGFRMPQVRKNGRHVNGRRPSEEAAAAAVCANLLECNLWRNKANTADQRQHCRPTDPA